ncbi:PilZ domain-containing protein [Desulfobacterota bacterium M19]
MKTRKERRKHLRLPLNFKVSVNNLRPGLVLRGQTRNISFAGAFIELDKVPPLQRDDYFSLTLLGQVEFTCRLIHSNSGGIGCQFDFIKIRYYEVFKNMMLNNAPDPERLVKELHRWAQDEQAGTKAVF